MPNKPALIYWDSCVFISYLEKTPDRIGTLDAIIHNIRTTKDRKIVTSAISKVEVAFLPAERPHPADPAIEQLIDDFWNDDEIVELVEFHDLIATHARTLMRQALPDSPLKSNDAIQVATALWLGVRELQTYDTKLLKYGNTLGIPIVEPYTEQPMLDI